MTATAMLNRRLSDEHGHEIARHLRSGIAQGGNEVDQSPGG